MAPRSSLPGPGAACSVGGLLPQPRRGLQGMPPPGPFSPSELAAPTPSRSPLKCLQACVQREPLPHRTTSDTALTTGRSGLDLLKDPEGAPAPRRLPGSPMGSGFGWWLCRERQRAKSWSPPPPGSPQRLSPPPPGPVRGGPGPGRRESGYRGMLVAEPSRRAVGGSRGHPLPPSLAGPTQRPGRAGSAQLSRGR